MTVGSWRGNPIVTAQLLNGMKQLRQSGGGHNLRLTPTACHNRLGVINTYRTALKGYRDQAADLADPSKYGNPGGFPSATQTVSQLPNAVTDANNGIVPNLDGYIPYLDELKETVNATLTRIPDRRPQLR